MGLPNTIDAENQLLYGGGIHASVTLAASTTTATTTALPFGLYVMISPIAGFFRRGGSSITATTAAGQRLLADTLYRFHVTSADDQYVAVILDSSTATVNFARQGP